MVTLNPTFHMSPNLTATLIPDAALPEVHLLASADGAEEDSYTTYGVTKNPDVAHKIALQWLAAERAMRKRASDKEAERLRAEAERAAGNAKLDEEADQLRWALYGAAGSSIGWQTLSEHLREQYRRAARKAREIHGARHE